MKLARAAFAALALAAGCSDGTGPSGSSTTLSGRVFTLDGAPAAGLVFSVRSRAGTESVGVSDDGTFRLTTALSGDSVDYLIDAAGAVRAYHPAFVRAPIGSTPDLRILLIPRQWRIEYGSYAGTTVAISADAAFRPPCTDTSNTNCDGFFPRIWTDGLKLWPATSLPVRIAFDRVRSHQPITASDSVAYWAIVSQLNADFGMPLFSAARYEELVVASDGRPDRAIVVRVDTTLSGFGAWTTWSWNAAGELYSAVLKPARATYVRSVALMTHELLHTQGFKHSCSWSTVMGGYGSPPCGSQARLSPSDVAHAHVALRVRDMQRTTGAPHGLLAALQGERTLLLNLALFAPPQLPLRTTLASDAVRDGGSDHAH